MPVPVTVITGFLGAGKTTLLQYILSANHGKKILVIQNEFSDEMGIESPQLVDSQGQVIPDLYELPNGCMCCSVRDSFVGAVEAIFASKPGRFDYVVVETAGLADPEKVVGLFWMDSELGSDLQLDGVIAVVDAYNISKYLSLTQRNIEQILAMKNQMNQLPPLIADNHLVANIKASQSLPPLVSDSNFIANVEASQSSQHGSDRAAMIDQHGLTNGAAESSAPATLALAAVKQIASANVILLNKIDLVTQQQPSTSTSNLEQIESTLHFINPYATISQCEKGRVPLDQLLDLNAFAVNPSSVVGWFSESSNFSSPAKSAGHPSCHHHDCAKSPAFCEHHDHHPAIVDRFPVTSSVVTFVTSFFLPPTVVLSSTLDPSVLANLLNSNPWIVSRPVWTDSNATAIFGSLVWKSDGSSDKDAQCGDIFRYKGLFLVSDKEDNSRSAGIPVRLAALQGVGEVFEIQPVEKRLSCIEKLLQISAIRCNAAESCFEFTNKFLFIGHQLNIDLIKTRLTTTNRNL